MTYHEASILLVEMISDLRSAGYDREDYHEAVAIANGVLYAAAMGDDDST